MARGTETRGNGTRRPPRRTPTTRRATSDQATSGAAPDRQAGAAAVEEAAQADEAAARRPDEALQEAASPTPVAPDRAGVGGARLRNDVAEAMATAAAASGAVTAAAVAAEAARVGDPVQRAQEQVAVLIQEQIQGSADTVRRLMTCTSLPAAVSVQVEATGRAVARLAAHGQAVAALGREMVRAFDPTRRR